MWLQKVMMLKQGEAAFGTASLGRSKRPAARWHWAAIGQPLARYTFHSRKFLLLLALLGTFRGAAAAPPPSLGPTDSLRQRLATAPPDSNRVLLLAQLAYEYTQTDPLATIAYGRQALLLAQKLKFRRGEALALVRLGSGFREAGNYPAALQIGLQGLQLAETQHDHKLLARALNALGYLNWEQGNSRAALAYFFKARAVAQQSHDSRITTRVMGNIGNVYRQLGRLDSARSYLEQGYALDLQNHDLVSEVGDAAMLGNIYTSLGNVKLAQHHYRSSIHRATEPGITFALCRAYLGQARLFPLAGAPPDDSARYFGLQALAASQRGYYPKGILEASEFLATVYAARRDSAAAFRYLTLANATRDSLFSQTKMSQVQALDVSEHLRQKEQTDREAQATAERRQYWLLAVLASAIPAILLLWHNNRLKQRANQQLNAQNEQIASQRDELREVVARLQATQSQLVQAEKMAFLGELTAGIAHELQNPLAFVKNFAEVSTLLVDDIASSDNISPDRDTSQEILLAGLKQNLREISQHGQRATSIISGMLARSSNSPQPCTPTDINALVTENLRLAYQGLRAKNKHFAAARTTHLAPHLPAVPAVAPELGRVLINLFTNAFYAVQQRQQTSGGAYTPEVCVSTCRQPNGSVEIRVRDNGSGIPAAIKEKIFQPFFTTKPPTDGTGLGLSLAHQIVTQAHGGTLRVNSQEGEFTEFIICLPS